MECKTILKIREELKAAGKPHDLATVMPIFDAQVAPPPPPEEVQYVSDVVTRMGARLRDGLQEEMALLLARLLASAGAVQLVDADGRVVRRWLRAEDIVRELVTLHDTLRN